MVIFFSIKTGQIISGIEKEIISIKCGQTKKTWDSSEHLDYPKKTRYLIFNWPIVHVKADGNRAVLSLEVLPIGQQQTKSLFF